jgi:hypothetical protein
VQPTSILRATGQAWKVHAASVAVLLSMPFMLWGLWEMMVQRRYVPMAVAMCIYVVAMALCNLGIRCPSCGAYWYLIARRYYGKEWYRRLFGQPACPVCGYTGEDASSATIDLAHGDLRGKGPIFYVAPMLKNAWRREIEVSRPALVISNATTIVVVCCFLLLEMVLVHGRSPPRFTGLAIALDVAAFVLAMVWRRMLGTRHLWPLMPVSLAAVVILLLLL